MSNPILYVFYPTFYVFASLFSLVQMQVLLTLIGQGVSKAKTITALEPLVPGKYFACSTRFFVISYPGPLTTHNFFAVLSNFNDYIVKVFG